MNHHIRIKSLTDLTNDEIDVLRNMNMGARGQMKTRFLELLALGQGWAVIHYDSDEGFINGWALMFRDQFKMHQADPGQICIYMFVPSRWRRMGIGSAVMEAGRLIDPTPFAIPWDKTSSIFYTKQTDFKVSYYNQWVPYNKTDAIRI